MKIEREFSGGYAKTKNLYAVIEAKKKALITKRELDIFCATLESEEAGQGVPLSVIVNRKRKRPLTEKELDAGKKALESAIAAYAPDRELTHKVPRKFLRAAATGRFRASEILCYLLYIVHRMPQRKRREALIVGERYGRLKIRDAAKLLGLAVCTVCEAFKGLRLRGLLTSLKRRMWEIKRYGSLLVDGPKISLFSGASEDSRRAPQKTRTQPAKNQNANRKTLPNNSNRAFEEKERKEDLFSRLFRRCEIEFGGA